MSEKSVGVRELLKTAGLSEFLEDQGGIKASHDSQYLAFRRGESTVHVESTASNLVESILNFPVDVQTKLVFALAEQVPEVGDTIVVRYDEDKRRAARLVRLKPVEGEINLLLTR